jgi:hypothetical protein
MVPRHRPLDDREVAFIRPGSLEQPFSHPLDHQHRRPLVPDPLWIYADIPHAADHPLKVIIRLAQVVDGRGEEHASSQAIAVTLRVQANGAKLIIPGPV